MKRKFAPSPLDLFVALFLACGFAVPLWAQSGAGKITGRVTDTNGVPQAGAHVLIMPALLMTNQPVRVATNSHGRFAATALRPGIYTVEITLAGFLPTIESNIQVSSHRSTSLQVELGSVFTGLTDFRRQAGEERPAPGDWSWVLRTSAVTRPVLRWGQHDDGAPVLVETKESTSELENHGSRVHSQINFTSGPKPGSATSFSNAPATSLAYDQAVGSAGRLLFAAQFNYESQTPNGSFATLWLPKGNAKSGPATSVVVRQSRLGLSGPMFRGMLLDQDGVLALSDSVTVRYGAEYLLAALDNASTSGVRPRAEVAVKLAPTWQVSALLASRPWSQNSPQTTVPLQSALDSLDSFPTILFRNGRPLFEDGWHEEFAVEHLLQKRSRIVLAAFHDRSDDTPVFGKGIDATGNPNFLQDFFSSGFAYDAGTADSWGARAAYQRQFSNTVSTTFVYAWGGVLAPAANAGQTDNLRQSLAMRYRHSLAGSVSSRLPVLHTEVSTGYKWINGVAVSRLDEYGEAYFGLDPYFNLVLRQPIPCLRHMMAVADFGNLLAQGYVPMTTSDGRVVMISAYRTFRGGISLQF